MVLDDYAMTTTQHLCNGLALPRSIPFLHGNWHSNGLSRTDSVLAYGHRGCPCKRKWSMASAARLYRQAALTSGQTSERTIGQRTDMVTT